MGAAVVAIILAALALAAVLHPILRRGQAGAGVSEAGPSRFQELLDLRETLVSSLKELENDRGLGNIDEAEYRALRDGYERDTAIVLRALDARTNGLSEAIEADVSAVRLRRLERAAEQAREAATPPSEEPRDV